MSAGLRCQAQHPLTQLFAFAESKALCCRSSTGNAAIGWRQSCRTALALVDLSQSTDFRQSRQSSMTASQPYDQHLLLWSLRHLTYYGYRTQLACCEAKRYCTALGICNVQHVCISQCDYTECYARSCMQHDSPY